MRSLFSRKTEEPTEDQLQVQTQTDDSLIELRKLLVGPLQSQFEEMQEMMKDQGLHPEEVSKILPEAIMIRSARDEQIIKAMEPITEETIKSSIRKDPRILVDVLVPVMLPAIKKAIATLIKEMIQTFSATLEHGLSMRGLKWRFEAFKSKRPFGEIALIHSLVYQVEQVFLIHKETGLVLQHLAAEDTVGQDPDMVSAMLTAIQDFVRDSFGGGQDDSLDNLQFGDRSVWIEQTSQLVLAAVVWGNAPVELQKVISDTLTAIHFEHIDDLRRFDGNTAPFERSKGRLSDCLRNQFKPKKHNPFLVWTLMFLLIFGVGYWAFFAIRDHIRWNDYLEKLHHEPGIVITETDRKEGKYYVFGLRDPLSANPSEILKEARLEPDKVRFSWELYHSSHSDFVIRRIRSVLSPPETVTLEMKERGILRASGSASQQWLAEAKKLAEAIPGVLTFQTDDVMIADLKDIKILGDRIENILFFFDAVSTEIKPDQADMIQSLARHIRELHQLTRNFDKQLRVEIVGHTDSTGTDERNMEISQERAEKLFSVLTSEGLDPELFIVKGVGSRELLREERSEADREFNRCVNFRIMIQDTPGTVKKDHEILPESSVEDSVESDTEDGEKKSEIKTDGAEFGPL